MNRIYDSIDEVKYDLKIENGWTSMNFMTECELLRSRTSQGLDDDRSTGLRCKAKTQTPRLGRSSSVEVKCKCSQLRAAPEGTKGSHWIPRYASRYALYTFKLFNKCQWTMNRMNYLAWSWRSSSFSRIFSPSIFSMPCFFLAWGGRCGTSEAQLRSKSS